MIPLADANRLIEATLAKGADLGLKPLTVAVLDPAASLVAFQRQASFGGALARPDIAIGKARAVLALGIPASRRAEETAAQRPAFIQGVIASYGGPFVAITGALAIVRDGTLLGAVGVSGDTSDNDEKAAIAGLAAIGLKPAG